LAQSEHADVISGTFFLLSWSLDPCFRFVCCSLDSMSSIPIRFGNSKVAVILVAIPFVLYMNTIVLLVIFFGLMTSIFSFILSFCLKQIFAARGQFTDQYLL
jgi:hypothetical protein